MTALIIIISVFMLTVTPFRVSLRGIFNSLRMYSATNITLFRFILAFKARFKIEDKKIFYSLNNGSVRTIGERKVKRSRYRTHKLFDLLTINRIDVKVKYGVKDDAMRTAIETTAIMNALNVVANFLKADKVNIEVYTEFNRELIAIDLDIQSRVTVVQIILMLFRILKRKEKTWKT